MYRRSRLAPIGIVLLLALGAVSEAAFAGPKDAPVKKLDKDAMDNDFLLANFADAEKKLGDAIKACGASGCTPKLKAMIYTHLGIVQVNAGKTAEGETSFVEGLKIDPSVSPEADFLENRDVDKAFNDAKRKAAGAGASSAAQPSEAASASEPPAGELTHKPVAEQMVNTPVPIHVLTPEGMTVAKVIVMFKPFGGEWKKQELRRTNDGWTGLIPCVELGTTGDLKYYVKALDASGDQVASSGSLNTPFVTKIKSQLDGDPPHLPKQPPPGQCAAKEDCPPGLPGCPSGKKGGDKGWGAACESSSECQTGLACKNGSCEEGGEDAGGDAKNRGPYKKNWFGLTVSPDFAWLPGGNYCTPDQPSGYACFNASGDETGGSYSSVDTPVSTADGFAPATVRILLSYDRAVWSNIAVGTRIGFAFNGSPKPQDGGRGFLPIHFELRGTYWFGKDAFSRTGFRPFAFVGGGLAQVDGKVSVAPRQNDQVRTVTVDVWRKAGQQFVALGAGFMYALNARGGLVLDLKYSQMFPDSGSVISPEISYVLGF